jgi:hypothetical protein
MTLINAILTVIVLIIIVAITHMYIYYREPAAELPDLEPVDAPIDMSVLNPTTSALAPVSTSTPASTSDQSSTATWTVPEPPKSSTSVIAPPKPASPAPAPAPTPTYTPAPLPVVAPSPTPSTPVNIISIAPDPDTPDPITPTEPWVMRCGPENGGAKCTNGACCSIWGWCGGDKDYCGAATNMPAYNSSTAKVM